jgi:hypothetical protein
MFKAAGILSTAIGCMSRPDVLWLRNAIVSGRAA